MTDVWSYFLEFKGEQFELDGADLTVGRSRTCDVSIKDPSVSRQHVHLTTAAGKVQLTDLGSSNGTFINGERIQGGGVLGDGDTLGLGDADVLVHIVRKAGFETVRMPRLPAGEGELPQFGEATGILQKESVRLAMEALGDDLEGSRETAGSPAFAEPAEAGSHMAPPAPPPAGDEMSFADLADNPPDFDLPAGGDEPSFAAPEDEPEFAAPDFSVLEHEPAAAPESSPPPAGLQPSGAGSPLSTQVIPTPAGAGPLSESPKATIELPSLPSLELDIAPPESPRLDLPEPPVFKPAPKAPLRLPEPAPPAAVSPAGAEEVPPAPSRSGDELLPSLDGFDATLGPGSPIPESMLRAQENVAKVRAQVQEPLPKLYEQPIQVPPMAGFWVRLVAVLLDDLWMLALSAAGWLSLQEVGAAVAGATSLLVILSGWAIWGTTPGKRVLGLYVCTADGQTGLGVARAALRLFGYFVSTLLLGIGFLMVLSSSKRGLHDRIADTYVRRFK